MKVLTIGLGSMGYGAAISCLREGLDSTGFDLNPTSVERFIAEGGKASTDWQDIDTADAVLIFVVNAQQAESVLFESPLLSKLNSGATVVNCVTLAPHIATDLAARVEQAGFGYVDAPVSGGAAKARDGRMSIMASGHPETMAKIKPVFDAISEHVFALGDEPGAGSQMKLINQLLAGVHIAAAAEAMNLAASYNMDLHQVIDVISKCAGSSWMFENRAPHIADGDYTPLSSVNIFVKDMGIVTGAAEQKGVQTPLSQTAFELYKEASDAGFGLEDDSAVVKILAQKSGTKLPGDSA